MGLGRLGGGRRRIEDSAAAFACGWNESGLAGRGAMGRAIPPTTFGGERASGAAEAWAGRARTGAAWHTGSGRRALVATDRRRRIGFTPCSGDRRREALMGCVA